jgi:ribosomal protein L16 Arg81 hydroxylase
VLLTITQRDSSWLAPLIAPVSPDDFIRSYWTAQHLFCRGESNRFAHLLSWGELNEILEHHWREVYRFRLSRQGRDLEPASYADLGGYTPRVRARDVTDHLRRGATLSFDAIDELHPPLTRLAESFEACFRGGTKINIYAGWRALHGLDLHRDRQEIFIFQLDGRKRWLIYGLTFDDVDLGELRSRSVPPAGALLDQVLAPGDVLYIPRGCYHVALPMNEPTLHLTIGVKLPRGRDILDWLSGRAESVANRNVPTVGDVAERRRFSTDLRESAAAGLSDDLVEQYLTESGSNSKPRPSFSLPFSATDEGLPPGRDFVVRLNPPIPTIVSGSEVATLEWRCGARVCRFPRSMRWIVTALADSAAWPFSQLVDAVSAHLDESSVRFLLGMLVSENLIAIRHSSRAER